MKRKFLFTLLFVLLVTMLAVSCSTSNTTENTTADTIALTTATSTINNDTTITSVLTSTVVLSNTTTPETTANSTTEEATITTEEVPMVQKISPEEAKDMMEQGGVVIVDVRRADEYAEGHIPGAILVPNETILTEAASALPDRNAILLVYCRSGRRSAEAAEKLISLGYRHVYDFGGILDWNYETTK